MEPGNDRTGVIATLVILVVIVIAVLIFLYPQKSLVQKEVISSDVLTRLVTPDASQYTLPTATVG